MLPTTKTTIPAAFFSNTDSMMDFPVIPSYRRILKVSRFLRSKGCWKHVSSRDKEYEQPSTISIITWNVDFASPYPMDRLEAAIDHIRDYVVEHDDRGLPEPCCILLQEVHADAFPIILNHEWVKQHFFITPTDASKWPHEVEGTHSYGNVTLIERSIKVAKAEMVEYGMSKMDRTAIMTDVWMKSPVGRDTVIRIINTHLESLPDGGSSRAHQMYICARSLKDDDVSGGIIAGDMNALSPADDNLVATFGLRDSYWRKHPEEVKEGHTWGYQGKGPGGKEPFPPGRLDKILFMPNKGFRLEEPRRIGIGVKMDLEWVSDHYGLATRLHVLR